MKVRVRPGEGRRVTLPGPDGKARRVLTAETVPAEGVEIERDLYVFRRLQCGDLVELTEAAGGSVPRDDEHGESLS